MLLRVTPAGAEAENNMA